MQYFGTNLILFTPIIIGLLNLLTPFISKEDSNERSIFLFIITIVFLLNVILLDYLFLSGYTFHIKFFSFGIYSINFSTEGLGLVFLTLLAVLWLCSLLYTIKFLNINNMHDSNRFLFFMNACIILGSLIAISGNLFTMFCCYELLTLATMPLIVHFPNNNCFEGLRQYVKILVISSLVLFLPAVLIIYEFVGHGDFMPGGFIGQYFDNFYAKILFLMLIFGCAKASMYPLHSWLPAAMVAPYPVSAILHAVVVVKTGLFCIYKIIMYVFGINYLHSLFADNNWMLFLPIITIIYSSFKAIGYTNIKMVLAYSTINQLAIALLSAFLFTPKGMIGAVLHMVSHSFTKICLFYTAGNMYSIKTAYRIDELIGLNKLMPKTSCVLLIAVFSLIGMPPLAGFVSKWYILLAAMEERNLFAISILVISSIFSALYMTKLLVFVYKPVSNNFISDIKLKPYFDKIADDYSRSTIINSRLNTEKNLPHFMLLSIGLCTLGVVGFIFIQKVIRKFLLFI
ncbi:MAG: cation:proton antiporter [Rickettsiaceae bacterium]|nr:cation:proton antiporter [Rickettsiaceae bacterium]